MRVLGGVVAGVLVVGVLGGIVWVGRYSPAAVKRAEDELRRQNEIQFGLEADEKNAIKLAAEEVLVKDKAEPPPLISPTGPHPRIAKGEWEFEFGTMARNEMRKHNFTLRNEGQAPLMLSKGGTTCKCTISELPQREIAPGSLTEVEISWTPRDLDPKFRKEAQIQTNDPENPVIRLLISGKVVEKFTVAPSHEWNIGAVQEGASGEVFGLISSALFENFKILGVESSNSLLTADYTPLSEDKLKTLGAKSGYEFKTRLAPGIAVGPFSQKLRVRTDIEGETVVDIVVKALRPGPLRFLPATGGARWFSDQMTLNLGRFASADGKTASLPMFVSGMDQEFKLLGVETNVDFLNVSLASDPSSEPPSRRTYRLKFEIPPGKPPIARTSNNPGRIKLKTNHPQAEGIEIELLMVPL